MRKITEEAYNAFINKENFIKSNTIVSTSKEQDIVFMTLFGNCIAKCDYGEIYISDGGYGFSRTTQERLSAFDIKLKSIKGQWMLNDIPWNGKWIKIN